jgi:polyisoprenyl-teichoic acid--peptidoglycan teichoic acid transferase
MDLKQQGAPARRPQAAGVSSAAGDERGSRYGSYGALKQTKPARRRPWFARKRVLWPLLSLFACLGTIGFLWWNIPVVNPLTGEQETYGDRAKNFGENLLSPRYSLSRAFPERRQISVLLVGLDHVPEKKGEDPAKSLRRSDSVILGRTDFGTKQIRLLSIPRDGWVEQIQENGEVGYNKLAHTYANGQINSHGAPDGGIRNTADAVARLTGITPDFYVVIQFEGLAKLVDALGGLEVDVEKDMNYDDRHGNLHIHLKKGLQHLNGEEVVGYARFRHDALGDLSRMGRQQKVMKLLLEKLMDPRNVGKLPELVQLAREYVQTNFSYDQLLALAQHMDDYAPSGLQTQTLPSYGPNDPEYPSDMHGKTGGMAVQVMLPPDVQAGSAFLMNLEPPPPPAPPGTEGAAAGEAGTAGQSGWQQQAGESAGSADTSTDSGTQ